MFEWLLKYIKEPIAQSRKINKSNVISILVSGDFLKIPGLDNDCARFIAANFEAINALNIDFSSLSESALSKIASEAQLDIVLGSRERVNKLVQRILQLRVKALVEN